MFKSAQQTKKLIIDLNYYVINHQWIQGGLYYFVWFPEQKIPDLTHKDTSWERFSRLLTKKERKKKRRLKSFYKHLLEILGKFP